MKRALILATAVAVAGSAALPSLAFADSAPRADSQREATQHAKLRDGFRVEGLTRANPRDGVQNNRVLPGLSLRAVAWGSLPLTNPNAAAGITHYGYNTSTIAAGGALTQGTTEAFKTEPDKNVYLSYGGRHFLYQGHELGPRG